MPVIKSISDLRNNFTSISTECHENGEPVYLTKNGKGDMVAMSIEEYERLTTKVNLYEKLLEAELSRQTGPSISHEDMMKELDDLI